MVANAFMIVRVLRQDETPTQKLPGLSQSVQFMPFSLLSLPVSSAKLQVSTSLSFPTPHPPTSLPSLPLPDKPSIIVLSFVNLSNDPEQEYFSDAIIENLTNFLSRISRLSVAAYYQPRAAHNSSS
jgi:hypothetical protein